MIFFDVKTKVFDTDIFLQHTIADMNSGITFYCFIELREAFKVKGNKYTHTHTHTHTYTHTRTHAQVELEDSESFSFLISSYKRNKKCCKQSICYSLSNLFSSFLR